jgi:hypothetical protein
MLDWSLKNLKFIVIMSNHRDVFKGKEEGYTPLEKIISILITREKINVAIND